MARSSWRPEEDFETKISIVRKNKFRELHKSKICDVMASALRNKIKSKVSEKPESESEPEEVLDTSQKFKSVEIRIPKLPRKQVDNVKLSSLPSGLRDTLIICYMRMSSEILRNVFYNGNKFTIRRDGDLYSVYGDRGLTNVPCLKKGIRGEGSIAQFYVRKSLPMHTVKHNNVKCDIMNKFARPDFPSDDYHLVMKTIDKNATNTIITPIAT